MRNICDLEVFANIANSSHRFTVHLYKTFTFFFLPYSCTVSHKGELIHVVFIREGQDLFLMGFPHSR